ncbi:oleate hydratase [Aspergillus pseudonomiae]|uniref:Oleate hydratase n=1 Tax=Aspergillus pseudonomiae TaxID=1506151 RepID=A0A5N7D2H1_9EURO|nr:oleate hydratase [Aspergillus pseudonomiae]KAE8400611.1 oleate hydratase [Aspergillus pseudonomiae]
MACKRQSYQKRNQRVQDHGNAWILGSSIASLASAVYLIQDTGMPASRVHILESRIAPEDGIPTTGDSVSGYDHRAPCLPLLCDEYTENLLSLVPLSNSPGKTMLDNLNEARRNAPPTRLFSQNGHQVEALQPQNISIGWKVRMSLVTFILKSEKSLGRKIIRDFFDKWFFNSRFWAVWSSAFGLCPWHSAVEFRRGLLRYFHDFQRRKEFPGLDRCRYHPQEDIILPITNFLQEKGVHFQFNTTVTDITVDLQRGYQSISAFKTVQNGLENTVTVSAPDVVIASLGSSISGSTKGTNTRPPSLEILKAEDKLDENWSLWLAFGAGLGASLGDPYNFCTRVGESREETFTISIRGVKFSDHFMNLASAEDDSTSIVLQNSNWLLSLFIPRQPLVPYQPTDVQVMWGYGSAPQHIGNFVKKPMLWCSGQEILIELLQHLNVPPESILDHSITIPRVMPRLAAPLLPRACADRPRVIPECTTNLAVVGQFVEIPDETAATMDYSIHGAQVAIYQLMGVQKVRRKDKKHSIASFLGF